MHQFIEEKLWFKKYQPLLLSIINTDYGRDLLCVDKAFPQITMVGPNYIQTQVGLNQKVTEFRSGSKYGKVIRHRWDEFANTAQWFTDLNFGFVTTPVLASGLRGTTTTVYPSPGNFEDGRVYRNIASETWSTIQGGAGTDTGPSEATGNFCLIQASTTSNQYSSLRRSEYAMDTSAITDTDVIDSAVLSLYGTAKSTAFSSIDNSLHICQATFADVTTITTTDYQNMGSTSFGNISYAAFSDSAYNDITLNASGEAAIDKTGATKLGCRMGADITDTEPTWGSGDVDSMSGYYSDQAGTSNDPKLVITHTAAPVATRSPSAAAYGNPAMY